MYLVKKILSQFGYTVTKKKKEITGVSTNRAERFPIWVEEAKAAGEDVNDFMNKKFGNPKEALELICIPYVDESTRVFLDLGPGTGRFAREMIPVLSGRDGWKIYLVDHSQWIVTFLSQYFSEYENIEAIVNDGTNFADIESNSVDIILGNGVFIALNLPRFYSYGTDSLRILRSGGYLMLNYLDLDLDEAWEHMKANSKNSKFNYSYTSGSVVDKLFQDIGFTIVNKIKTGSSNYIILRKPQQL